jgi:hypothetical protein
MQLTPVKLTLYRGIMPTTARQVIVGKLWGPSPIMRDAPMSWPFKWFYSPRWWRRFDETKAKIDAYDQALAYAEKWGYEIVEVKWDDRVERITFDYGW